MTEPDLFHELPCGVLLTDGEGKITALNRPLLDWLGYAEERLVGKFRFNDLLTIGGKIFFETHHANLLDLQGEVRELNYEMVDDRGERYPALVNARRRGNGPGFIYTITPYRERRKFEQELKQAREKAEAASRAKATFLSTMSHEIRTPLHAILEAGKFLARDRPRPDQLELIEALRTAGNNLLSIVNDILDISKMESGMLVLDERPFQPTELLRQVELTYRHLCRQRGIELRVRRPEAATTLLIGDAGKLTQVLNNLVSNAVKFTSRGYVEVTLAVRPDGERTFLDFTVSDSGTGIPSDRLEAIFEPFTQAEASVEQQFGGTGLGLAICQRIVRAYGSRLHVRSELGRGTSFQFTLHLRSAAPSTTVADISEKQLAPLDHLRLLNVDDNPANLLINARYFKIWNLPFRQARSGSEALALLEREPFDLVLLDLQMPGMTGYELARQIRRHPRPAVRELPLIALSAMDSREITDRMKAAGIDGLLRKPFSAVDLHALLLGAAPPGSRRGPAPFDLSAVRDMFEGAPEEEADFLTVVRQEITGLISEITAAVAAEDVTRYEQATHKAISMLRLFGLEETLQALHRAGKLLEAGQGAEAGRVTTQCNHRLEELTAFLKKATASSLK